MLSDLLMHWLINEQGRSWKSEKISPTFHFYLVTERSYGLENKYVINSSHGLIWIGLWSFEKVYILHFLGPTPVTVFVCRNNWGCRGHVLIKYFKRTLSFTWVGYHDGEQNQQFTVFYVAFISFIIFGRNPQNPIKTVILPNSSML